MKITMTATVMLMAMAVHAQQWHFGPKADIDFTHIQGKGMRSGFTAGFQAGAFTSITWNNKWGIQPELLFTQSNSRKADNFLVYYVNSGNVAANENIRLSYISIPVLVRYDISTMVTLLAGPQYSFRVFDNENLRLDGKDAFKSGAFSANVGAQLNLSPVAIYARYNQGLSNINDIDDRYAWKASHIQVGIAVSIR